ncbi:ABC transporter substrate-binding protein [Halotalea alkalilenta]|uniref:Peptide ABC transporter substrate-binding protein n=1 Tax=Halotalea alkalilenta TaxID=376489 RepID=A0A172YAR4_9GAMM|nr:ABC transporter substrate-binding protein [Halotalea alkalilenta]ANF56341.1 peptide ABC transporter substrate-binding protein [Halotalea alkalilenta]
MKPLACIPLLLLCGLTSAGAAANDTITVAMNADIRSTQPGVNRDGNTDGVMMHVVEGLVGYREDGSVGPMLAQSYEVSNDGRTYTFHLREDVRFHNGETMTAEHVVWSWNRWMDPDTQWRCVSDFDGSSDLQVTDVTAVDDHTVTMTLASPSALFLANMARPDCGAVAVIHPDSLDENGAWREPVGTGPYKLEQWNHNRSIVLTRFADYASREERMDGYVGGKEPRIGTVRILVIPDPATVVAGLQAGNIDVAPISATDARALRNASGIKIDTADNGLRNGLLIQTNAPPLDDPRVRKAVALAIDTEQVALGSSEGMATPSNSNVPISSAWYGEVQQTGYEYDPQAARELLAEAGYNGEPIEIIANQRPKVPSYDVAIIAQSMMQAAGINARVNTMEWATQLDRYSSGRYQMMSFTYSARFDPALMFEQITGDKAQEPRKVWDDPRARELIQALSLTEDTGQRQALVDELHTLMIEQTPLIFLFPGVSIAAYRDRVEGFAPWFGESPRLWNVSITQ